MTELTDPAAFPLRPAGAVAYRTIAAPRLRVRRPMWSGVAASDRMTSLTRLAALATQSRQAGEGRHVNDGGEGRSRRPPVYRLAVAGLADADTSAA
jgi:hypothetical protein